MYIFSCKNPNATEVTQLEGNMLITRCRIKQSARDLLDTPKVRCNLKNMYKNLFQNGSSARKELAYLRSFKKTMLGFDYRVHYDNEVLLNIIMWMTLNMRNLLQYGDIFSLIFR